MFWCVWNLHCRPFQVKHIFHCNCWRWARLDESTDGFWGGHHQRTYFDVKVFNPIASSYRTTSAPSLYQWFEKEKRRKYEQRVREVELSSFVPLVFSTFGGMTGCTHTVYKRLAYLLSLEMGIPYCNIVAWLQCSLSFLLLGSAIDCLRGARSHGGCPVSHRALDFALAEGQVPIPLLLTVQSFIFFSVLIG